MLGEVKIPAEQHRGAVPICRAVKQGETKRPEERDSKRGEARGVASSCLRGSLAALEDYKGLKSSFVQTVSPPHGPPVPCTKLFFEQKSEERVGCERPHEAGLCAGNSSRALGTTDLSRRGF